MLETKQKKNIKNNFKCNNDGNEPGVGWKQFDEDQIPINFMQVLLSSKQIMQRNYVSLGTICKIELSQETVYLCMYTYILGLNEMEFLHLR